MLPALFLYSLAFSRPQTVTIGAPSSNLPGTTLLNRTFKLGLSSMYKVRARLHVEQRESGLLTYLPEDIDVSYDFYTRILKVEAGDATMRYFRPSISELDDDGSSIDPKPKVIKLNLTADYVISPINATLDMTDLTPKKKNKKVTSSLGESLDLRRFHALQQIQIGPLGQFLEQVQQLALFIGGPDTSLDFAPQFSLYPVKIGDTWKQTVGYQPQNLSEGGGKIKKVVQRLDLTYTYKGKSTYQGKPALLVTANINLNTDLAKYVEDQFQESATESHLKSFPLKLKEEMNFYLNPKTLQIIYATVHSKGGFKIISTLSDSPLVEVKLKGINRMKLVSSKLEPVKK